MNRRRFREESKAVLQKSRLAAGEARRLAYQRERQPGLPPNPSPASLKSESSPIQPDDSPALAQVLVRIPEVFAPVREEVLRAFGAQSRKWLGSEYCWIKTATPTAIVTSPAAIFARWNLPLDHTWPCNPSKIEGFLDKAADALARKFASRRPQAIFIGVLNPGSPDRYFKNLAANLRDKVLRNLPALPVQNVEDQDPDAETLFGLVGREGLYCGMRSPRKANGFFPGGSKFVPAHAADIISRAGAKIAEALHYLRLHRPPLPAGSRWLELGACPGGMTSELLNRGFHVNAIDVAPLDKRLDGHPGLTFVRANVMEYQPAADARFDALLCDMNGPPAGSIREVVRLAKHLVPGGLVIFTLKLPRVERIAAPLALLQSTVATARAGGLTFVTGTHLTCNGHEFTLFFEHAAPDSSTKSCDSFRPE